MKLVKFNAPELEAIEKSKAEKIKETFEPMAKMLSEFENAYNDLIKESKNEITLELCNKAKRLRLDVGKVRIETGKLKDKQKEYIKLEDKAIMGVHNILVWAVKEKEDTLKDIENFFETQEKERLNKLQLERALKLEEFEVEIIPGNLADMEDDVWKNYLAGTKMNYDQQKEAERKTEDERIEQEKKDLEAKIQYEKEQEAIRKENERLKKDAEKKEAERQKEIKARQIKEEKEHKERERLAKIEAAKLEKVRLEAKAKEDKLKAELKRVADEKEAERIRLVNEEKAIKKAEKEKQLAPDKEKLMILATQLNDFKLPVLNSTEAIAILEKVKDALSKTSAYIIENINKV